MDVNSRAHLFGTTLKELLSGLRVPRTEAITNEQRRAQGKLLLIMILQQARPWTTSQSGGTVPFSTFSWILSSVLSLAAHKTSASGLCTRLAVILTFKMATLSWHA